MKVLLVKPPRFLWPYLSEDDNILLPQALPCLASVLRENDIEVKIVDCVPLKIGWNSLRNILAKERPHVVGISESETMWSHEGIKASQLAKELDPDVTVVAGGNHFSNLPEETLKTGSVDFVVKGEGEYTFLDLVKEAEKTNPDFKKVKGIYFKKNGKIMRTHFRPLINDLDELPLPAYDLLPMDEYGKSRYLFHPGGATIHHSRGCSFNCDFCSCWIQMGQCKLVNGRIKTLPRWRTKSVERTMEEIELLYYKYKKRGLVFTDDNWNFNPKWNEEFADAVVARGLNLNWFAFMRADHIIRDSRMGILKKLVDAGLSHVSIGVERHIDSDLKSLNKTYTRDIIKTAFRILKENHPSVFRQGTFIIGLKNETRKSVFGLLKYVKDLDLDYPSFSPLTPVPGTVVWKKAKKEGRIEVKDFKLYDWFTPIMSSERLTREEIANFIFLLNKKHFSFNKVIRGLLSTHKYKRKMYMWFMIVSLRILKENLKDISGLPSILDRKEMLTNLVRPKWYYD